ncbi:MAG: ABC transporter permease subunit, partial [Candidatus Heimdallarchaeaceae archaeon]
MRWDRVWALAKKDVREFTKSKYVFFSVVFMPLILSVMMALSGVLPLIYVPASEFSEEDVGPFFDGFMGKVVSDWANFDTKTQMLLITAYGMLFFVSLVPIIVPSIIASETIVGEKERKTMESLLASPLSETEIVAGKILSAFLPSIIGTIVASIVYAICIDWMLWPYIHRLLFPDSLMLLFTFIISPLASILCVELMIMISTKMSSVRDAYQIGSLIVMPVFFFVFIQMVSFFFSSLLSIIGGTLILVLFAIAFFKIAENIFDREKAIVK